jgi:predicted 3-demethylubiquinone-9 3-methyltransferase (glyoxalase superfamily)
MATINKIAPCLWFDNQGEEAARFYVSIFKNSAVGAISHYGKAGFEMHRRKEGSVMTVAFTLDGQEFLALNGGPLFKFNEAVSLMAPCETQAEIDYYWDKLGTAGGGEDGPCGWLKDKYGLSWQIAPANMPWLARDGEGSDRAMAALMQMKKLDIAALERAYNGK